MVYGNHNQTLMQKFLPQTPYLDDEGDGCSYYLYVYDEADNHVNSFYYNIDQNDLKKVIEKR